MQGALIFLVLSLVSACGDGLNRDAPDARAALRGNTDIDVPSYKSPLVCQGARQTGCGVGEKCAVLSNAWKCTPDATRKIGETCTNNTREGDDCAAGLHCYERTCQPLCTYADLCSNAAEKCIAIPSSAPLLGICLGICDPLTNECPNTASGTRQGCYLAAAGAVCAPVAKSPPTYPGARCEYLNECVVGSGCIKIGATRECAAYCDYQNNPNIHDSHCPATKVCRSLLGKDTIGFCGN